jgi:glycosyltransferase involved in cell wall biosynthesis
MSQRPVAHIIYNYLNLAENWIYELIHRHRRFPPLVLTAGAQNLDLFPLPNGQVAALERRSPAERLLDRIERRLLGMPIPMFVRAVRKRNAALVHAHIGDVGWQHLFVARRTGRPLLASFYGYDVEMRGRDPLWRARYAELFGYPGTCICLGEWMRERLIELGCPPEKALVLPFGANLERMAFSPRRWDGHGAARAIMVANFVPKKGHAVALEALARVRRRVPQAELWLVGDGELRPQIEAQIGALGLGDAVRLLGRVPYPLAGAAGAAAHLFVLPSHTAADGNQEGLPMVLIEAQAIGLPVLSTVHACIPEVVEHGASGLLAPEGDIERFAENWLALLEAPERWPAMGAHGRALVEARYNAAIQASRLEDLYATFS